MTRITADGKTYRAASYRSGTTETGRSWELLTVVDENGKNEVTIFPENVPCGIDRGECFTVTKIASASVGHRKGQNGNWYPSISINAVVAPADPES